MKHDITHRGTTQCRRHVSIYCNGFYYHLSAPDRQGAQIGPKINGSRTVLKVTEYSDFESEAHRQLGKHPGPVLVGYHVGQTDYDPEQIQTLSEWIIENLGIYNFFSNNCQHFVFCLLSRIICRGRRDTVFMGSMKQIATLAAQAQRGELMLFKNGFYEGFCLSGQDCAQAPLYSKLPRLWTSENKWYEHPGTALKYMYHWGKWVRSNQRMDLTAHQLCVLWNQGQMGLLPNNILEYSAWRRQLLFPTVTRRFPKMRLLLLKSGSYPEDK
ncbi:hypothetical protein MGYG_06108 [Nannizzia gypsea CBS 118893]|uniref:PPPDE domain-containing protein n=1 Tax=Arthroderma gypseum (strain ATCC MYA-4604 / CBS 118893) TaxID=535722 RepID=E4V0H6_ARTGP|nr:hypothetical protein MGYG_06108 [Nannizzia gypsea CBS 118893]EFR03113.1 hypothetical protein MGYG_06108 [Nannizzia gypsea CBS 118893]